MTNDEIKMKVWQMREDLRFGTEFAVSAINEPGEAGRVAMEILRLGQYQGYDNVLKLFPLPPLTEEK